MGFVDQRILACPERGDGHDADGIAGDCAVAAWATLMGISYDEVPHFAHYPESYVEWEKRGGDPLTGEHGGLYWRRVRRWLRTLGWDAMHYDWDPKHVRFYTANRHPWSGDVLLSGPSPRGDFAHIVVGRYEWFPTGRPGRLQPTTYVTHDPHPSRDGLVAIESVTLLVYPYDPPPPDEPDDVEAVPVSALLSASR